MSNVIYTSSRDIEMEEAYKNAQETFKYFYRELSWEKRRIVPALDCSYIKLSFCELNEQGETFCEHMWVNDISCDGEFIYGTLISSPNDLKDIKQGDPVKVKLDELEDWMYSIAGKVYGGHTINLLRSRMTEEERKGHDDAWGLDFGDPNDISLVYTRSDSPEELEATLKNHPMCVNSIEEIRKELTKDLQDNPEKVNRDTGNGWTMLHYEALEGNAPVVEILLEMGADASIKNSSGLTALDMAQNLGWDDIVSLLS